MAQIKSQALAVTLPPKQSAARGRIVVHLTKRLGETLLGREAVRLFERAISPQIAGAFALAIVIAALLVGLSLVVHLATGRRRARVFISFQHERESIADALASEMAICGIAPVKLPFVENPDHNTLLDQVKQAIRDCDVFVCLPGERPSFVESEVLMAFGLEKPLLFVLTEAETSRLPNTAKKGYPMFALERLQRERFRTLANFCSYLAADWRSTVRLYGALFGLSPYFLTLGAVLSYLASILAMLRIIGPTALPKVNDAHGSLLLWAKAGVQDPPTLCFVLAWLALFLVPYGVLIITRLRLRNRIRRAIATERFSETLLSESFLSRALDYSLAGADLLRLLYRSDVPAEHEWNASQARND